MGSKYQNLFQSTILRYGRFSGINDHANTLFRGKPKKGRTSIGPRDVKKIRSSNEAEFDEEDDPDMGLR